ncbi:MAG: DUF309 domain-containing protein [Salinirussus sp.]
MEAALGAGAAIFNAGRYHAAHDAWEDYWLDLESGTEDERFLHGLIQFTAAVHHATNRNWSGATGLAESAVEYLDGLNDTYRDVNIGEIRDYLRTLAADPEVIERHDPPRMRIDGTVIRLEDLDLQATIAAAHVYAEADGYDAALIDRAADLTDPNIEDGGDSVIISLLFDFVRKPNRRDLIYERLGAHVERQEARASDVDGLFESND